MFRQGEAILKSLTKGNTVISGENIFMPLSSEPGVNMPSTTPTMKYRENYDVTCD